MGKFYRLKKYCAAALAVITAAISIPLSGSLAADTNAGYYVKFVDNNTGKETSSITVIEGETVKTVNNLPPNRFTFASPPFVVDSSSNAPKDPIICDDKGNITVKTGIWSDNDTTGITIHPSYRAFVDDGSGELTYPEYAKDPNNPTDPPKPTGNDLKAGLKIKANMSNPSETGAAITQKSSLTFSTSAEQTALGEISFTNVTAASGDFEKFKGGTVDTTNFMGGKFKTIINSPVTGEPLQLDIEVSGLTVIPKGSKFEITFYMPTVQNLIMSVISADMAVKNVASQVQADFQDYILLNAGDEYDKITSNFKLKHVVPEYNTRKSMTLEWEIPPMLADGKTPNPLYAHVVILSSNPYADTWSVNLQDLPPEDMEGSLKVTVKYTIPGSATEKISVPQYINIRVLGTGVRPSLVPNKSYIGKYNKNTNQVVDESTAITEWPAVIDVYSGNVNPDIYDPGQRLPYKLAGTLNFGSGLGRAEKIRIKEIGTGDVEIYLDNSTTAYSSGSDILNSNINPADNCAKDIIIQGKKAGDVTLQFECINKDGKPFNPMQIRINIVDHSPSDDATFKKIILTGTPENGAENENRFDEVYPNGVIDFKFDNKNLSYKFDVPYQVSAVSLTPFYNLNRGKNGLISITSNGTQLNPVKDTMQSEKIKLDVGAEKIITVNGVAEEGTKAPTYTLMITRKARSPDTTLSDLSVSRADITNAPNLITFNKDKDTYDVEVPFACKRVFVKASTVDQWAVKPQIKGPDEPLKTRSGAFINKGEAYIDVKYKEDADGTVHNVNPIKVIITSEIGTKKEYTINVKVIPPNKDNQASLITAYREKERLEIKLADGQKFTPEQHEYYVNVPYSASLLSFDVMPNVPEATRVRMTYPSIFAPPMEAQKEVAWTVKDKPIAFNNIAIPIDPANSATKKFDFKFEVMAESEKWTEQPYVFHVQRNPPDKDARLSDLKLTDVGTNLAVNGFVFNKLKTTYDINVPYSTENVLVTPVALSEFSKVYIDGKEITKLSQSRAVKLGESGKVTAIQVLVIPESGAADQWIYTLNIRREGPGTDARLSTLNVGGLPFKPDGTLFVPSKQEYTVEIPKGTIGTNVTFTTVDPKATTSIDGKPAANGTAFGPIQSLGAEGKITIIVTAEDGKTQRTYIVHIKDWNFVTPSKDADLSSLIVSYGDLSPAFKPNIVDYEVYVKPDTMHIDMTPTVAHRGAKVEVLQGTRKITPYDRIYSSSLIEDENVFTIKVTPEDMAAPLKEYTLTVYRNDEEKQGTMKPITADMVDYTANPVKIDISKYAVVEAGVFNRLKSDNPDATVIFQGNDYTLEMKASDINGLVPNTQLFDLSLGFYSPDEQKIEDLLDENDRNDDLDQVYVSFHQNAVLPAPMKMTLSLGRDYRNDRLYWNYYNKERERIDYYGYVNSNAKGTLTVPVTHLGTYIVTVNKVQGAENKSGMDFGGVENIAQVTENVPENTTEKYNPSTGVGEKR